MNKDASFGALYAMDDLGRLLPGAEQVGPPREDRVVGCFYFLTHGAGARPTPPPCNVSELMQTHPEAKVDFDHPGWGSGALYWGEPLFGYYFQDDPWVLRRHVKLLTHAGVDFLVFDTTNRQTFWHEVRALLEVLDEYRREGWNVPKVAYYTNTKSGETVDEIWHDLYAPGLFRELWFEWEGKPFIIADPQQCTPEQRAFFTFRLPQWPTEEMKAGGCPWIDFERPQRAWRDEPSAPTRAHIYATGLGVYLLKLNGKDVGDEVLAPYYNDYNLWLQYQTYDVTDLLCAGENRLDAWLGNGWYKGRFGFIDKLDKLYGDRMQLLLEMRVELADGSELVLGTDESWICAPSPILESSIYDGEVYDARLEGSSEATPAAVVEAPKGRLTERLSPPLRITQDVPAKELIHTPAGEWVLDFGQLMTGWVEFDCELPEGAKVLLEHGELLQHDNFYTENLRTAKQQFTYISNGHPAHVAPHFTFYGFRFVKVTGIEHIRPEDFHGKVIHSDLAVTGRIETSNPKVNQLFSNAFWGQRGNFVDVPTDCPQRDERMGWTGDAQVFAPTASFNMYTPAFYDKFLYDMLLEQRELDGSVPHVVPDILDQIHHITGHPAEAHGACAWSDAATVIPWTLYTFFGDRAMLARHFENMKLWTDWIRKQDETRCGGRRLWTCGFHFADWLALDNPVQGSSFGGTDPYYVASAYYYYSALLTSKAAEVLGREAERAEYAKLAEEVREAFRREFFTPTGRIAEPTQTAMTLALYLDLVPEEHRARLRGDLKKKIEARNWHLDTGFVGTYFLCKTLAREGMADVAYTLLLNEDFPSWLYEVNMGATTIWERWNSVLPSGLVSDTGMNSMNHYAYGSIVEWMYSYMCGLNPVAEAPGFRRARIAPVTDPRFDWVKASYDSASGLYESAWRHANGGTEFEVTVPFDCEAEFVPETAQGAWTLDGAAVDPARAPWQLSPGRHRIAHSRSKESGET